MFRPHLVPRQSGEQRSPVHHQEPSQCYVPMGQLLRSAVDIPTGTRGTLLVRTRVGTCRTELMTNLNGTIDRSSPVPFHLQLRKLLEEEISSGRWTTGHRLPSEPFLTDYYRVSRATVRQALLALQQKGLIRKEKGRGAFVARA